MITLSTLFRFFVFDAKAIRTIASNPLATWLGLLFVVSAGFAREYDGEYLVAEPWHALIPIAASLIGCSFMVVLLYAIAYWQVETSFLKTFRTFLNVYWMTAPLAWLYAIPVEQFFDPGDATRANLWLLALVSIWRVALMVRCVQVIYKTDWYAALVPVMLFSDILAMTAIGLVPGPIFMIMGGVRLNESESIILNVRMNLQLAGYLSMPIWIVSFIRQFTVAVKSRDFLRAQKNNALTGEQNQSGRKGLKQWQWSLPPKEDAASDGVGKSSWGLAVFSILIWIPILPMTQQGQWLRWKSEKLIHAKEFEELAKLTTEYPESEFPRHWDPPPRLSYREKTPSPFEALVALREHNAAPWIIEHYERKIKEYGNFGLIPRLERFSDDELVIFVDTLARLDSDESRKHADRYSWTVERALSEDSEQPPIYKMSQTRRDAIDKLVSLMSESARNAATDLGN